MNTSTALRILMRRERLRLFTNLRLFSIALFLGFFLMSPDPKKPLSCAVLMLHVCSLCRHPYGMRNLPHGQGGGSLLVEILAEVKPCSLQSIFLFVHVASHNL